MRMQAAAGADQDDDIQSSENGLSRTTLTWTITHGGAGPSPRRGGHHMAALARGRGGVEEVGVDLLSRIFSCLSLSEFFKCSLVSHEYREGCTISFATQLQWRDAVQLRRVSLPPLAGDTTEEEEEEGDCEGDKRAARRRESTQA